jgi:hypothetical protein
MYHATDKVIDPFMLLMKLYVIAKATPSLAIFFWSTAFENNLERAQRMLLIALDRVTRTSDDSE